MATTSKRSRKASAASDSNGKASAAPQRLSDANKTQRFWRAPAPEGATGDNASVVWLRYLAKRRTPRTLQRLCDSSASPLSWGLTLAELSPRTVELLALVEQLGSDRAKGKSPASGEMTEQILAGWLEGSHALPQTLDFALECLAVANALPQIAESVLPEFWWSLLDGLWQIVHSANDWRAGAELPPEQGLAQQMLAGELPLTLAYLLPEMRLVSKLRAAAHEALSEGLAELTNGNGLLQGDYLGYQRPLLACWTRCRAMGDQLKKGCWNRKSNEQFQWLVTHALGMTSAQGTPMLGKPHAEAWTTDFLQAALKLGGDQAEVSAARSILGKKLTTGLKAKAADPVPATSDSCEWSGVAYMRTDWQRKAPLLAIDYSSPDMRLECWNGTQRLLAGAWTWETTLNGERLEPLG